MKKTNIDKLITEALAIEAEAAKDAGAVGYMARALVQATMPHKKQKETTFLRENGSFSLALMAHPKVGLPYGSIPRLLIAYLTTEAVRTKNRHIELGQSLNEFMAHMKEVPTGGRWGTITRVKNQTERLFASSVACSYTADDRVTGLNFPIADKFTLWWDPKTPDQTTLFTSYVNLGERFFEEVVQHPVPIDLRALKALKKSSMALDIYCWLTYRMSYVRKPVVVPWEALEAQFGAQYNTKYDFKKNFIKQLKKVRVVYPAAKVDALAHGLELRPSRTHITKR